MLRIKKCITTVLAIMLVINVLQINISAEGGEDFSSEENTVEMTEAPSTDQLTYDNAEVVEETQDNHTEPQEPANSEVTQINEQDDVSIPEEPNQVYVEEDISMVAEGVSDENAGENFAKNFKTVLKDKNISESVVTIIGGIHTITISEGQGIVLDLLSQQKQTSNSNYQNYNISFSSTGNISLSEINFKGLGSEEFPFKGNFTGTAITIQTTNTIFNALYASADLNDVKIDWQGTADKPILAKKLIADESQHEINMPLANAKQFSPYINQIYGGSGQVTLPDLNYSAVGEYETPDYRNVVGLACGEMVGSTSLQLKSIALPSVPLKLKGTSVGSLIGSMGDGTTLTISQKISVKSILNGTNVGGLVGSMTNAVINFAKDATVSVNAILTASQSAGGIAGEISTSNGPLGANANVVLESVKANGEQNSGVLYGTCAATGEFKPLTGVTFGDTREVSGLGNCGGLFGELDLSSDGICIIFGTKDTPMIISSLLTSAANTTSFGGIVGKLTGYAKKNALVVYGCNIMSTVDVGTETNKYPKSIGGIVAIQGNNTTVDTSDSTVTLSNPRTPIKTYGIGGLCSSVGDSALLKANNISVVIDSFIKDQGSSGIAATTGKGAVLYLENIIDLSKAILETCKHSGQIVGMQDCSLIYAPKARIKRLQTTSGTNSYSGVELDDIGNYGEMYRIVSEDPNDSSKKPFVSIESNYEVTFNYKLKEGTTGYTLSSKEDYACLALAWQSRGYFQTVNGINTTNWFKLKTSTITFDADIDLTGCGIGGLTRDVYSDDDTFSGKVDGMSDEIIHKITLDIGADNQENTTKVSKGDGRIYWHNATGLFACLSNDATVQNLTLDGSIRLSNNNISPMSSGALAAQVSVSQTTGSLLSKVSTAVKYDAKINGGNTLYLGGLIGQISAGSARIDFDSGSSLGATIDISQSGNGSGNHIGGVIGGIASVANAQITCNGATLSGSITSTGTVTNLYTGGLIGTIMPKNNSTREVIITNLNINGFALTGNAAERMGGILGGIWSDTDVNVDGLNVNKTTLTASGTAALGGLVYRASGKWSVSSLNLSGFTISAQNASALGLMVCHGEPYKEPVNSTTLNNNVDGLYLEMSEHWDWNDETEKGYNVPSSITFGNGIFDEFVAYTAYADRSSDTPNYQITSNGSGIISLKTENDTVNMTSGERNTYTNRTSIGQNKQTNKNSRYYYNLPTVKNKCDGGNIDTANELLMWSVYRYAASNLKSFFSIKNVNMNTNEIGGNDIENKASFDMEGISYYPINITNSSITVKYADVKFYNDAIETKESENKLTRQETQHYMMHCALFNDYMADNIDKSEDYTLTVNVVSFAGTVGKVNGGSGVLICGNVKGLNNGTNIANCKVILADSDHATKAVKLNGISVDSTDDSTDDYRPVLINRFADYSSLEAKFITSEQNMVAGSSLFGKVEKSDGENAATNVSILFEGTVKLSEMPNSLFTKATLFHYLHYSDGSVSYNFNKDKDYSDSTYIHNATYGNELADSKSVEYAELQGNYLDGDPITANNTEVDFSQYLPYVAHSPATNEGGYKLENNWHEIAVNVRFFDLTEGCGTYGHPYMVDTNTLTSVANYINNGRASNGWQLRVPTDAGKTTYHIDISDNNYDVIITYQNGKFFNGETEYSSNNVREYLQSAIYQIKDNIVLENFGGIGTKNTSDGSFKGVIYGGGNTITLSGGSSALIKYSYGSVVRDLTIVLNNTPSLNRTEPARPNGLTEAKRSPDTFFGGVIGSILGGDNIIENVTITVPTDYKINPTGSKTHLVPIGGFVGVINGGGVIFRGSCTSGYSGDTNSYYNNPFIGRVLGGFAFYEGGDVNVPDNSKKNNNNEPLYQDYKINKISAPTDDLPDDLEWDGTTGTLAVNTAQGLLVLSSIVSSGAGSTTSVSYLNGVARNAKYDKIGQSKEQAISDFNLAQSDISGTASYLLKHFSNCTERVDLCTSDTNGISIKFAENATFEMANYDNGYRGLSARYVSNVVYKSDGVNASTVVMRIKSFDGQNATVQNINMDVKEYADDDFHMASMGGIFNIVWTQKQSGGGGVGSNFAKNLTLKNCNVSLKYMNSDDEEQNEAVIGTFANEDGRRAVSVGGFIGMANDVDATQGSINHNYLFSNIHIKGNSNTSKCTIVGPNSTGGLIGATAMATEKVAGYPGKLLANGKWALFGPSFLNCSYRDIKVTGILAAGGLVGDAYTSTREQIPNFSGLGISYNTGGFKAYTSCTVTNENLIVGENATITATANGSIAGGLFGGAGMRVGVNDPEVNTKSGISIVSNVNNIQPLHLKNVDIKVSTTNYDPGSTDRPDSNLNNAYAAGIIGRIGSVNPSCFYDVIINGGSVSSMKATGSRVGGIQGSGYTNSEITMERCEISSFKLSGVNAGGFLGNGQDPSGFKLNMSDCKLENSEVIGSSAAGGLVGDAKSFYYLYNILIKNTSIKGNTTNTGRLFGKMTINSAGDNFGVYAAGISVYADKEGIIIPDKDGVGDNYNGYIAYGDYSGVETIVDGSNSPYVTVNPNYTLKGSSSESNKILTGDAIGKIQGDTYNSVAARIWADSKTDTIEKKNLAPYVNASSIVNATGKTTPEVSTFREIQGYLNTEWTSIDLPVLVLKGNDASTIEDYLNVITNGGYGVAKSGGKITVNENSVSVYYYNKDSKTFSLATDTQLATNPASIFYENGKFNVRSRSFDNTLDRFSLVEVNFNVTINGVQRTYTVSLPVVVIRELQFDYMATFSYGKEFMPGTYDNIKTHLLESTGNPFTVYLTYQYNREKGDYREYDWQTYINDGGSMLTIDKVLHFSSGLPEGTQMILIDCQNGNQAYQFTTAGDSTYNVQMSKFTSLVDGTIFQSSMADVLGVTRSDPTAAGKFVETVKENATVRLNGKYYQLYKEETDADKERYDLTVPDLTASVPTENYYLVITVPDQDNAKYYINGSLTSSLNWTMPSSGTKLHRYINSGNKHEEDNSNNTESTYQISTGYRQDLVSTADPGKVDLSTPTNKMQVKLQDTITFSNKQVYGDSDQLFLKFTANLKEHKNESENGSSEERQFPVGISGTVKFYVRDPETKNYYTWNGERWNPEQVTEGNELPAAASYRWESNGGKMELLLSADGQNALDLAAVRQAIKGNKTDGESKIVVTAEMDVDFETPIVLETAIPGSDKAGADIWAQMHYISQISTQEGSIDYSSMRDTTSDKAGYYRNVTYQAVLSMDAANIDQLGVNPLQLVEDYQETVGERNASRIDLNVVLDLANLQDVESLLKSSNGITFTLSLKRRNINEYADVVADSDESVYTAFKWNNDPANTEWSWTISKEEYYANNSVNTSGIFDGTQFSFPITAYVFTDKKNFANYRINLSVSFDGIQQPSINDSDAYVVYTYACIKPTFYEFNSGN